MSVSVQPFRPFKKRVGIEAMLDAAQKIFEGEFRIHFYGDRAVINGYCWHCQSKVHYELRLEPSQARAIERDQQFRKNIGDYLADELQRNHQCGLLYEGRDRIEDVLGA